MEAGAEELVGVVISMGPLSGGPDIWMVGVRMGTVRGANGSSFAWPSLRGILCGLRSITCAICRAQGAIVSMIARFIDEGTAVKDVGWTSRRAAATRRAAGTLLTKCDWIKEKEAGVKSESL